MRLRSLFLCGLALCAVLIVGPVEAGEKVDVVFLDNGDRVTGEVKKLDLGKLEIKTTAMGTLYIEWIHVRQLQSEKFFELEDEDGNKYYGMITPADEQGRIVVLSHTGVTAALTREGIVRIAQIGERWLQRWKGFVDLGYSYTSANSANQFTLDADATYRARAYKFNTALKSTMSSRTDAASTKWNTLSSNYEQFLKNRWYWAALVGLEQNDEIKLDLRATVGGAYGRYVIQTNRAVLALLAGATANREIYSDQEVGESGDQWTMEALLGCRYDLFIFGSKKTTLSSTLLLLPSLSESDRYRVNLSSNLRRDLWSDFTVAVSLSGTYDSKPPTVDTEKSDFRFVTSLGWSF